MPQQAVAERCIAVPQDWADLHIEGFEFTTLDGNRVRVPKDLSAYSIRAAHRYPTDEQGELIAGMTLADSLAFLEGHNKAHGTNYRSLFLFEDEILRRQYGRYETNESGHQLFDENFSRTMHYCRWGYVRWGYVIDRTMPPSRVEEINGIDGKKLIQRVLHWDGKEVGLVSMEREGMVPIITKAGFEKTYGADALARLEKLGVRIPEKSDEEFSPVNALGYPQFTLEHEARDESGLIKHSHHFFPPSQEQGEAVGVRYALWRRPGGRRSFYVSLCVDAASSYPDRSFPLVRGGGVEAKIIRPDGSESAMRM